MKGEPLRVPLSRFIRAVTSVFTLAFCSPISTKRNCPLKFPLTSPLARRGMCERGTFAGSPFAFDQSSYFCLYSCFLFPYLHQKKLPPKIPSYLPPSQGEVCVKGEPLRVPLSRFIGAVTSAFTLAFCSPISTKRKTAHKRGFSFGGDARARTVDLLRVKQAL